ncbi:hypothetical protein [Limnohabitans planktonicus]|uniref:Uncharacterized protein n=1 Tax=Limnohabitans planktonicus II-D5 TaxID=1293045 RepID=A0A2T7UHG4_9BURK|nr:hypothetical protein [Limnohabitans planktonicus]PVE44155.1 hypothetical protein H663_004190 [Limnohabitans planktonicus II-D5]
MNFIQKNTLVHDIVIVLHIIGTNKKLHFMNKIYFISEILILSTLFSSTAHAYVDGGTALLLLQGAFAAIGAALVFLKKPGQLIAKIFSRKKTSEKNDA